MIGIGTEGWSGQEGILAVNQVGAALRALSAMLRPLDRPVVTAGSGPRALALASKKTFAVIVLDVLTSNADAIELVLRLRALHRANRTPIILLTSQEPATKALNQLQQTGLVDYILRPVPPELLRSKVATILAARMQEAIVRQLQGSLAEKDRTIAMLAQELQNPNSAMAVETMYRSDADEYLPGWLRQLSRIAEWVSDMDHDADRDARVIDVRPSETRDRRET